MRMLAEAWPEGAWRSFTPSRVTGRSITAAPPRRTGARDRKV